MDSRNYNSSFFFYNVAIFTCNFSQNCVDIAMETRTESDTIIPILLCKSSNERTRSLKEKCLLCKKGKAIPLQAWTGPEGSRRLRLPNFKTIGTHEGGKFVSPTHQPPLPPGNIPGTHFLLEAKSTSGP